MRRSLMVSVVALLVAACDGGGETAQSPTPSPTASPTPASPSPSPSPTSALAEVCDDLADALETMGGLITGETSTDEAVAELEQLNGELLEHADQLRAEGETEAAQVIEDIATSIEDVRSAVEEDGDVVGAVTAGIAEVTEGIAALPEDVCEIDQ